MNAEIWASIGTVVATLVLLVVPVSIYSWYAIEHLIAGEQNAEPAHESNPFLTVHGEEGVDGSSPHEAAVDFG